MAAAPPGAGGAGSSSVLRRVPSVTFVEQPPAVHQEPPAARIRYSQLFKSMTGGSFISGGGINETDINRHAFDSAAQPAKPALKQPHRRQQLEQQYPQVNGPAAAAAYQSHGGAALVSALGGMAIPPPCPPALPPAGPVSSPTPGAPQQHSAYARMNSDLPNPLTGELPRMQPGCPKDVQGAARSLGSNGSLPLVTFDYDDGLLSPSESLRSCGARHLSSDDDASLIRDGAAPSHAYGPPEPARYKLAPGPGSTAHVTVQLAPINTRYVDKDQLPQLVQDQQQQQQHGSDAWQHVMPGASTAAGPADVPAGGGNGGGDDDNASSCAGIVPPGSQQPLPPFWGQLTLRAVLVGLLVGFAFLLLNLRLALVTGLTANLQVVITGACWVLLRCYTSLLGRDVSCIRALSAPEVSVAASTALAVSSSAAAAGFGSVLLALQDPIAQRVGYSIPNNLPSLVWQLGYWRLVGYMMMVGLSGALLVLPFRKLLFARPSMTFATGAAAGQLVNTLHTPAMSYHGHKQVSKGRMLQGWNSSGLGCRLCLHSGPGTWHLNTVMAPQQLLCCMQGFGYHLCAA
eukprot:GHRQ01013882.1.p1 GENE.GHRQ01013882.1~~GHRQ01013882.1.p1  ORF type:complete len:572 (+),score=221.28 GHRQ01013882.1:258-1973(+)